MSTTSKALEELLYLLKSSYECPNSSKLLEITQILNDFSKDLPTYLNLLFQGLSLNSLNNFSIPYELHQSIAVNLKNIIIEKKMELNQEQISSLINKIFELYFRKKLNQNLIKDSILYIFKHIIMELLSLSNSSINYENLFQVLIHSLNKENNVPQDFISYAKIVVIFVKGIFESKLIDKNNCDIIVNNYYMNIIDILFKNVPNFIDPGKNLYNDDYFNVLNILIENMYLNMKSISKIKSINSNKYEEIISNIFKKYGKLICELIKIQLPLDEESKKLFINQNPIISFNISEKFVSNLNLMKSKCFQYISFTIEHLTTKVKSKTDTTYTIKDEVLISLLAELMSLIIKSLQDILSNKEKYSLVKNPKEGILSSDESYNNLFYFIFLFLTRCLIRDPIKSEFSTYMKFFMLNILFPFASAEEEEKNFMMEEPDTYISYLDDILNDFKFKNFRTSLLFLIKKILENYDEGNLILIYVIEMLTYIFDVENGNHMNSEKDYTIYLNEENKSVINNFNNEIKIDFGFIIILLMKKKIQSSSYIFNKFINFFMKNQDKIHIINSDIILIKICEIYKQYVPYILNSFCPYKEIEEGKNYKKVFIENMLNFLLNIIINSNNSVNNNKNNDINEALIAKSSEALLTIFQSIKDESINNTKIKENLDIIFKEKIQKYFKSLINMINIYINNISFIVVISNILNDIKINERNDIYNCLQIFTNKFIEKINDINNDTKSISLFINQYFILLNNFLKGENKFNKNNNSADEIIIFNNIINPIISCISYPDKFIFYEEIIEFGSTYLKELNMINDISIKIFENIYLIINKDKIFSYNYYSFVSYFLSLINTLPKNNASIKYFNDIINIMKLVYSLDDNNNDNSENRLYISMLTLQILGHKDKINTDDITFLILENLKYFEIYFPLLKRQRSNKNILNDAILNEKIQQILMCNFSIFLMFYSDILFQILFNGSKNICIDKCDNKNIFELVIKIYSNIFNLIGPYYYLLAKCNILCFCSFFSNSNIGNIIFHDDFNYKKNIFKFLINLVTKHRKEGKQINQRITEKEIQCNFIENEENEDDSCNEEDIFDKNFNEQIKISLKDYYDIVNCDEFKVFSNTFYGIKNCDEKLMKEIVSMFNESEMKFLKNLLYVRNIKIEYNGEEIEIPRRTLKIKRKLLGL